MKRSFYIATILIAITGMLTACNTTSDQPATTVETEITTEPTEAPSIPKPEPTKIPEEKASKADLKTAFSEIPDNTTIDGLKKYCDEHKLYYAEYEESYSFGTIYYKISYDKDCAVNEYGGGDNDYIKIVFDSEENGRVVNYISYNRGDVDRGRTTAYRYLTGYLNVNHEPIDRFFVVSPRTNGYYPYSDAQSAILGLYE